MKTMFFKWPIHLFAVLFFLGILVQSRAQATPAEKEDYVYKKGDPNGTGKWYMGREIAHVMGFQGMQWLENPSAKRRKIQLFY